MARVIVYKVYKGAMQAIEGERTARQVTLSERSEAFGWVKVVPNNDVSFTIEDAVARELTRIDTDIASLQARIDALTALRGQTLALRESVS